MPFVIASRSDSTLRGHFPAETDALAAALGGVDGVLICPAFFEGGRVTAGDVHFVRDGDRFVPAAETEFARDATFGYSAHTLPGWVEEKTHHRIRKADVASLTLEEIRGGGPARVAERLRDCAGWPTSRGQCAGLSGSLDRRARSPAGRSGGEAIPLSHRRLVRAGASGHQCTAALEAK